MPADIQGWYQDSLKGLSTSYIPDSIPFGGNNFAEEILQSIKICIIETICKQKVGWGQLVPLLLNSRVNSVGISLEK